MTSSFVPADFIPPTSFDGDGFRLVPLGPEHDERDFEAWTSSLEHIRATPGFETADWPRPMSLEANRADLERHARDFAGRVGFTYAVLEADAVIGCVYIYPPRHEGYDAAVTSWVRASRAEIDIALWRGVSAWLASDWPFMHPEYASRRDDDTPPVHEPATAAQLPQAAFAWASLLTRQKEHGEPYLEFIRSASLSTGLYVLGPGSVDAQQPHHEDEIYVVMAGGALFSAGDETREVRAGDVIFVAAGVPHRFHDITDELRAIVVFAPAEGSEP